MAFGKDAEIKATALATASEKVNFDARVELFLYNEFTWDEKVYDNMNSLSCSEMRDLAIHIEEIRVTNSASL